jgi:hypothetical protein
VTRVVVTDGGSGYSSPPRVAVKGLDGVPLRAALRFDRDLRKNGAFASVEVVAAPKRDHLPRGHRGLPPSRLDEEDSGRGGGRRDVGRGREPFVPHTAGW